MTRRDKPAWQQKIGKERIEILFREAEKQASKHPERANRYIFIARKIAMKLNIKMPRELRRKYCHKCYHFLLPGKNAKVRTNRKTKSVEWLCKDCRHVNRYPYIKEKRN